MAIKKLLEKKGNGVKKVVDEVKVEGKIDIEGAGKELGLSIYRVRQLYWEGRLGEGTKVGKKIYLEKSKVEELVKEREEKEVESSGLEGRRLGKRVVKSCEVIMEVLSVDREVNSELKKSIVELLGKYKKEGEKLIEENK